MVFLCPKHVRMRVRYVISACLLRVENVGQSSVRENASQKKLWSIPTSSHWTLCVFLILNICVTLVHCLILTTWRFFCKNRKKARNCNWGEMFVPFFIPFSKSPHSDADQCQQKVGLELCVLLLLIDQSNPVKALAGPPVNIEGLGVWPVILDSQSSVLFFRDSWPIPWFYFLKAEWFNFISISYTVVYTTIHRRLRERRCMRGCAQKPV